MTGTPCPSALTPRQQRVLRAVQSCPGLTHPQVVQACLNRRYYYRDIGQVLVELTDLGALVTRPAPAGGPAALEYYPAGAP